MTMILCILIVGLASSIFNDVVLGVMPNQTRSGILTTTTTTNGSGTNIHVQYMGSTTINATSVVIQSGLVTPNINTASPSVYQFSQSHTVSSRIVPSYTTQTNLDMSTIQSSDVYTVDLSTSYYSSVQTINSGLNGYLTEVIPTSTIQNQLVTPGVISSTTYNHVSISTNSFSISDSSIYTSTSAIYIQPTVSKQTTVDTSTPPTVWTGSSITSQPFLGQTSVPPPPSMATLPKCSHGGDCCTKGLNQLPSYIEVEENQTPGTVLVPIFGVEKVAFHLEVVDPPDLKGFMEEYFNISSIGGAYILQISKYIDVEDLYLKANKNSRVTSFQFQVRCVDSTPGSIKVPPRKLNITILDVDDTIPVFQDIAGHESCVVPVYTADTSEHFVGQLEISPVHIRAVDGDLTQTNVVSYRVMHAEPLDYDVYFHLNGTDGKVSKTKAMNSSNPNKYVLFVEAMEESPDQQKRAAILSIKVVPNYVISEDVHEVNPTLKLSLEVLSVVVIAGLVSGFVLLVYHRKRVKEGKVEVEEEEVRDYKLPTLAVYESSCSSLNSAESVAQPIASPSAIIVSPAMPVPRLSPYAAVRNKKFIQRERSPVDTASRPGWNAPKPKIKVIKYNAKNKK